HRARDCRRSVFQRHPGLARGAPLPAHRSTSLTPPTTQSPADGMTAIKQTVTPSQKQTYLPLRSVDPVHTSSGIATVIGEAGQVAARAVIAVPRTTRAVPVRVILERLPARRWDSGRHHVPGPVYLALGEPGLDPDLVSSPNCGVLIINTQVNLAARGDETFDITGPYVDGPRDNPTLTLRWGTRTVARNFLLFTGAQLRLPRIVAEPGPRRDGSTAPALILTVAVTDAQGGLLRGVIAADDLAWQLTSRQRLGQSSATRDHVREAVIASTA
ncbi:MAG: hypothetical protein M3Y06_00155, partial [Actinomycetota bacterium]|nr:hypothetical protein [Actinomycetota bacterium]